MLLYRVTAEREIPYKYRKHVGGVGRLSMGKKRSQNKTKNRRKGKKIVAAKVGIVSLFVLCPTHREACGRGEL